MNAIAVAKQNEAAPPFDAARSGIARAMKRIRRPQARAGVVPSPVGRLFFAESDRGLAALHFLAVADADRTIEMLRRKFDLIENEPGTRRIGAEVRRYFGGDFTAIGRPVDWSLVKSDFQRRALERLRMVPAGAAITYSGLAGAVGRPDSQRAIGNAMASNPVPIFVPCHRVVRADGSIGNYGGGVAAKVKLLGLEGFGIGADLRIAPRAVLGNRATRIFCRPGCAAVARSDSPRMLIFADAEHASRAGLRPCKLCHKGLVLC